MPIEQQLRDIAHGDKAAFAFVFRQFQPLFLRYATGLLAGDIEAAEDVVNDAFIAIWQQADRFANSGSAQGWMRRIVRNKAVDWIRKRRERPVDHLAEHGLSAQLADDGATPFDHAEQSLSAHKLRGALEALSFEHREAVWLCYFEELSIAEIAEISSCPQNTVKTRLFHARQKLRESGLLEAAFGE
jgi:RNA polymerase sigma-70 factor (ECF subfamily)